MIEKLANPRYAATMTATLRQLALWCLVMALLLAIVALFQAIGGKQWGMTLASASGFGAGYCLHRALVKKGW